MYYGKPFFKMFKKEEEKHFIGITNFFEIYFSLICEKCIYSQSQNTNYPFIPGACPETPY